MSCYKPRTSPYIGGVFISADSSCRVVPDQWLHDATLENSSTLLRLCYSSCTMEIRGRQLTKIFEDASLGRLGTITVHVPADDSKASNAAGIPFVSSIIHLPMSPLAASDLARPDAA